MNNCPISTFLGSILIVVFILVVANILKIANCQGDFVSNIISNFVHVEPIHLISNLYGLYILSKIEEEIGYKRFTSVVVFIVLINSVFETIMYKLVNINCGIGFSSIIYGLLAWETIGGTDKNKNLGMILSSAVLFEIVSLIIDKNREISLYHHIIGMVSGSIVGLINI